MPRPILLRLVLKVLQSYGFELVSQKGSHSKWRHGSSTVIVPMHGKEIPYGTFRSILKQAKLSEADFRD